MILIKINIHFNYFIFQVLKDLSEVPDLLVALGLWDRLVHQGFLAAQEQLDLRVPLESAVTSVPLVQMVKQEPRVLWDLRDAQETLVRLGLLVREVPLDSMECKDSLASKDRTAILETLGQKALREILDSKEPQESSAIRVSLVNWGILVRKVRMASLARAVSVEPQVRINHCIELKKSVIGDLINLLSSPRSNFRGRCDNYVANEDGNTMATRADVEITVA